MKRRKNKHLHAIGVRVCVNETWANGANQNVNVYTNTQVYDC
jgi:hypothetical protein